MLLQHCHPHQKSQPTALKECQHRQTDAYRKLGSQSPADAAAKESPGIRDPTEPSWERLHQTEILEEWKDQSSS